MSQTTASAALRVISEHLSARDIADHLKIQGGRLVERSKVTAPGATQAPQRGDSRWILESKLEDSRPLQDHIAHLIAVVEKNSTAFQGIAEKCHADIWCTFSFAEGQGGVSLEAKLIERLSALSVDLIFGLYSEQA